MVKSREWVLAGFGAWFVVSAWALNPMHSGAYTWTAVILGALTLIGGLWGVSEGTIRPWRSYLEALFGLYLALTPFFYGFSGHGGALWITLIVGAATLAMGLGQVVRPRRGRDASRTS